MITRWSTSFRTISNQQRVLCPLSIAKRLALTDGQAAILDHALRQLLYTSPCLITQITRGLPDSAVDILDDLDGSLLDYLKRNRKFIVRQMPAVQDDGQRTSAVPAMNLVSLSAAEAVSTIFGDGRKIANVVHDIIATSPTAHLVGQGIAASKIYDMLNPGQRKQLTNIGNINTLARSYENVFELSADGKYVRLVDERTPVRPSEMPAAPSSALSSNANTSSVPSAPLAPPSSAIASSTSARNRVTSASRFAADAPLADSVLGIINILLAAVPFDSYVSLQELLLHAPTKSAVLHFFKTSTPPPSEFSIPKLIALLESVPSTALDCRLFDDNNPSMIFLRMIGDLKDATQDCRPDIEAGDALGLRKSPLPHTWSLLEAVLKQYEAALGAGELNAWFRSSFSTTIAPPTCSQLQLLISSPSSSTLSQPSPQSVEHLPPVELNSLCTLCARLGGLVADIPHVAPTNEGGQCIDDSYRPFVMLLFDRLAHLFDVNWSTYEVRVRREVMAAWWALTTSLRPPVQVGSEGANSVANNNTNDLMSPNPVKVDLNSVLMLVMASPHLRPLSHTTLDTRTTPAQRSLRQARDAAARAGRSSNRTTVTVDNLTGKMFPSSVAQSMIDTFGSVETFLRYHPSEFFIRDAEGTPLAALMPPDIIIEEPFGCSESLVHGSAGCAQRLIWTADQVARKRSDEIEQQIAETMDEDMTTAGGAKKKLSWSDNTIAQALYDTLPSLELNSSVVWLRHHRQLQHSHSAVIPHHVLQRKYAIQFFMERPHLFEVFELIDGHGGKFLVARKGVTPPPFGIHPKHCRSLQEAIKQLAVVCVGGTTLESSMNLLSTEARTLCKRYGGSHEIALALPMWFQVQGHLITYIGANSSSLHHHAPALASGVSQRPSGQTLDE
jgi:hypothetical protein